MRRQGRRASGWFIAGCLATMSVGCATTPRPLAEPMQEELSPSDGWPLFHASSARAGVVRDAAIHPPLRVAWSYAPPGPTNGFLDWGAVASDERIFTPNGLNHVVALKMQDGSVQWDTPLESNVFGVALSPDRNRLVVTTAITARPSPTLFVLNPRNGTVIWNNLASGQPAIGGVESAPIVDAQSVYVAYLRYDGKGGVCAYDVARGTLRWRWTHPAHSPLTPLALANGRLYVGFDDRKLFCLDAQNGRELWSVAEAGMLLAAPTVAGWRVVVAWDRTLMALEASTGRIVWRHSLDGSTDISSPAVYEDVAYVGMQHGALIAIRVADGQTLWTHNLEAGALSTSPAIDAATGTLWIGAASNTVLGVELASGRVVARQRLSEREGLSLWRNSPVLYRGWLFIGSLDKRFYALASSS